MIFPGPFLSNFFPLIIAGLLFPNHSSFTCFQLSFSFPGFHSYSFPTFPSWLSLTPLPLLFQGFLPKRTSFQHLKSPFSVHFSFPSKPFPAAHARTVPGNKSVKHTPPRPLPPPPRPHFLSALASANSPLEKYFFSLSHHSNSLISILLGID